MRKTTHLSDEPELIHSQTMNTGKTVFAQLMSFIPEYELKKCIDR